MRPASASQPSLFADASRASGAIVARIVPDLQGWQVRARELLAAGIVPAEVWWEAHERCDITTDAATDTATDEPVARFTVPAGFMRLAGIVQHHADGSRWALLYAVLWRLTHGERHLMQLAADPDVLRLQRMAKEVRRDAHKMKAFVRFRELDDGRGRGRFVAWFEPEHPIVGYTAGFFRRRFANMRWSILTPWRCAHWEGAHEGGAEVWFTPGADRSMAPAGDPLEDLWRGYYRSIFNPARLKVGAMRAEMPMKYWKNLPEADLIPGMVRQAAMRTDEMRRRASADDPVSNCGPRPAAPRELRAQQAGAAPIGSLERLALEARDCQRCPLWEPATQTVFGRGPADARLMLVGEQPGDREDLVGEPFVGPAGGLLRRALEEAGLDADAIYLTNAVKHFKFALRGKRRLHQKPAAGEVRACAPWLEQEIALVDPCLVVCLGATAAQALLGASVKVARDRGKLREHLGRACLVTVHPSYLLRIPDEARARDEYLLFVDDLRLAARRLRE